MRIFGVNAVYQGGKDHFYKLLKSKLKTTVKRFSLADAVREEIRDFCLKHYNIDSLNCNPAQKEQIRELLVFHAEMKRSQTNGRYWIDILTPIIKQNLKEDEIGVITDIRYYNDEVPWVKNELGGKIVSLERINERGEPYPPYNELEAFHTPRIRVLADWNITWDTNTAEANMNAFIKHWNLV